eukprot:TRINITY_DN36775_c0_g1_i1.p2 TRINITY_DN36775_c0_g1~~TRINITY_DN36775_c0_g1_i1.p2  ORF type:complete len:177 (+),score=64.67 TRINITY_DN36775_c0_g1_i1:44-574(+)
METGEVWAVVVAVVCVALIAAGALWYVRWKSKRDAVADAPWPLARPLLPPLQYLGPRTPTKVVRPEPKDQSVQAEAESVPSTPPAHDAESSTWIRRGEGDAASFDHLADEHQLPAEFRELLRDVHSVRPTAVDGSPSKALLALGSPKTGDAVQEERLRLVMRAQISAAAGRPSGSP